MKIMLRNSGQEMNYNIYVHNNLKKLDTLQQTVICLHSSITNTHNLLSARFKRDTVAQEETQRSARRKKEQRRKKCKRKQEMGKKQAFKLISNCETHGKTTADAFLAPDF